MRQGVIRNQSRAAGLTGNQQFIIRFFFQSFVAHRSVLIVLFKVRKIVGVVVAELMQMENHDDLRVPVPIPNGAAGPPRHLYGVLRGCQDKAERIPAERGGKTSARTESLCGDRRKHFQFQQTKEFADPAARGGQRLRRRDAKLVAGLQLSAGQEAVGAAQGLHSSLVGAGD